MKLIVGLGNPGKEYVATRHNAGFQWMSQLVEKLQVTLKAEVKFHGLCTRIGQVGNELWLLSPQTYMNASGQAVARLCHFYKIQPEQILVVHDELDLPPGISRLKLGGGLGGHKDSVVDYVLQLPRKEEAIKIDEAIHRSLEIWPLIARGDCQAAMLALHTKSSEA